MSSSTSSSSTTIVRKKISSLGDCLFTFHNDAPSSQSRKHLWGALALALSIPLLTLLFVLAVDPLQVFHNQTVGTLHYTDNARYRHPGLIRRHFYDEKDRQTALIGSSVLENFLDKEVEEYAELPAPFNFATGGLSYGEALIIYKKLIQSPSIKYIILAFEPHAFFTLSPDFYNDIPYFPQKLYFGTWWERLNAMWTSETLVLAGQAFVFSNDAFLDLEKLRSSVHNYSKARLFTRYGLEFPQNLEQLKTGEIFKKDHVRYHPIISQQPPPPLLALEKALLQTPSHITTYALIPPYSAFGRIPWENYEVSVRYLINALKNKSNVQFYGFDDVPEIVQNIANYYDAFHFGVGVGRYILRSIAADKHRITAANVEEYIQRVQSTRKLTPYHDPLNTVAFEGETDEEGCSHFPYPKGNRPLPLPE